MKESQLSTKKPRVGVGVLIKQNRKIILGRRLNQPMQGSWQLPGGWIRLGESPEHAVQRQLSGFRGLHYGDISFVTFSNNVFDKNTHTLSLYFMLNCLNNELQKLEKNEQQINGFRADWYWADWNDLPQPLFLPLQILKQSGFNPFREQ